MARKNTHGDLFGRVVAGVVILVGVAALVYVFVTAVHLFNSPVPGLGLPVQKGEPAPTGLGIGVALAKLLAKLAVMTIEIIAASLIATKGIHLYGAALAHQAHPDPQSTGEAAKT